MTRAATMPATAAPATIRSELRARLSFTPRTYPRHRNGKRLGVADRHNGRSMATVEEKAGSGGKRVSDEVLRDFFRQMLLIRRFEEKVEERFRAGELPGFLHVAIGQEAVATGVCAALEREDVIASTHRAHGHTIAKGTPINAVMAELYGKVEGCSKGYGGSMHLYDIEVGNLGANAVVAGGIPAIVGAALAFQMRGEKRIGLAFFGDGATNAGTFHESLNLAQLWNVPAVFVLENNGWAESTPNKQHSPLTTDELGKRALSYGMKLLEADGQDVEAVHLAALAAREHALSGKGPVLLHLRTYRLTGHFVGDPQVYRDKDELKEERETKDPIELLRARLELSDEDFSALDAELTAEVEASVEFAKAGTDPEPEDALKYVYA
jgi:acetoin:2,6-dichlorophenolindophenol oxidoreductase subunit alpha